QRGRRFAVMTWVLFYVRLFSLALILVFPLKPNVLLSASDDLPRTARYYRQQAAAAYKSKEYDTALTNLNKALELIPDHPTLFYNIAAISCLQGKTAEALAALSKIADMGIALRPEKDADFDSIKETPEFKAILKRFDQNRSPVVKSTI